jgi:AcrR family transcriptional regulator
MEFRSKLFSKALELFVRYGIKSVTMDDLAAALGVSKKTIYTEVTNKEELIDQVIAHFLTNEMCAFSEIFTQSKDAIEELLFTARHVTQTLELVSPILIYDLKKYFSVQWEQVERSNVDHIYQVISNNIIRGRKEGLYKDDFDTDIVTRMYVGKALLLTEEKLFPSEKYDKKLVVNEMIRYHIRSIATEQGLKALSIYLNQQKDNLTDAK